MIRLSVVLAVLIVIFNTASAQRFLRYTVSAGYPVSTLIQNKPSEADLDFDFKIKNNIAGSFALEWACDSGWSIHTAIGYGTKGARFADANASYLPRYQFHYVEWSFGGVYRWRKFQRVTPLMCLDITPQYIFRSVLKNSYETIDIMGDINPWDIVPEANIGIDYLTKSNHLFTATCFYRQGTLNIFSGIYKDNGLRAFSSQFGIKLGYRFSHSRQRA